MGIELSTDRRAHFVLEKPTAKAIQERLVKLRAEQRALLQHVGIIDHNLATVSSPERTQCDSNNPRNISSPPVTQATEYQSQAMKRPCSPDDIKETDVSDKVSTSFDDRKFQTQVRLCSPNTVAPEKLLLVGRQGNHPAEHQIWSNVSSTKRQRLENTPVALNEEDLGSKCACGNTSRKHEAI